MPRETEVNVISFAVHLRSQSLPGSFITVDLSSRIPKHAGAAVELVRCCLCTLLLRVYSGPQWSANANLIHMSGIQQMLLSVFNLRIV